MKGNDCKQKNRGNDGTCEREINMNKLKELLLEIKKVQSIEALLSWDQETYMPEGSGNIRSEHLAYLSTLAHNLHTGKGFSNRLKKLVDMESGATLDGSANAETRRLLFLVWKEYKLASALPVKFVEE